MGLCPVPNIHNPIGLLLIQIFNGSLLTLCFFGLYGWKHLSLKLTILFADKRTSSQGDYQICVMVIAKQTCVLKILINTLVLNILRRQDLYTSPQVFFIKEPV